MNKISTAIKETGAALWLVLVVVLAGFTSCVQEEEFSDDARGNFEALWKIMDEHYCFFGEKNVDWNAVHAKYSLMVDNDMTTGQLFEVLAKMLCELKDGHVNLYSSFDVGRNWFLEEKKAAYGLDWNEVYRRYQPQFRGSMTRTQQFEVLTNMLSELRDGHVNLYSAFDVGRNWSWHENYPSNFSDTLFNKYMGTDYRIAGSLRYRVLDDNIGFVRCSSFSTSIGGGNLYNVLNILAPSAD